MATQKQIEANCLNSKSSTGPRSTAGLEKVSRNAIKHGLCGRFRVIPGENQEQFDNLYEEFVADQKPVGPVELELVRKLAEYTWMHDRSSRILNGCFYVADRTPEQIAAGMGDVGFSPQLEKFLRYQAHYDRLYQRALGDLLKLRKERESRQIGFERQKREAAAEHRRETKQNQSDQLFKTRHATAQKRLECAEADAIIRGYHAATLITREMAA
jgi:hypothetical protein